MMQLPLMRALGEETASLAEVIFFALSIMRRRFVRRTRCMSFSFLQSLF